MNLTDTRSRPLKDLRISVTDRCNMRCSYCMPREVFGSDYVFLPRHKILTFEEIHRVTRLLVDRGVTKIRLTGGEPLLRKDVDVLIGLLSSIEGVEDIALTTNGALLPKYAERLRDVGLKRVTVSLDSLDPEIYTRMSDSTYTVTDTLKGIAAAEAAGLGVKVNTVVQRGLNHEGLLDLATYFRGTGHVLRFIEFMDVGNSNGWSLSQVVPGKEILEAINHTYPLEPVPSHHPSEVAKRFRYVDGQGEIGVITSVTEPFCGGCSRLRLSPDGKLFTCLFASAGHELTSVLRSQDDTQVGAFLDSIWGTRQDNYSEVRTSKTTGIGKDRVEMSYIGG